MNNINCMNNSEIEDAIIMTQNKSSLVKINYYSIKMNYLHYNTFIYCQYFKYYKNKLKKSVYSG